MKNIILPYPVLLHTPTAEDLPHEQSDTLYRLLRCADRWLDGEIIPNAKDVPASALYGSTSAIIYCESEEIHPIVVSELAVDELITAPDDIYDCWDIHNQLCMIDSKVKRIKKLDELNCPEIIMMNEGRQLWESVECLFYNGKSVLPAKTYEHEDADGKVERVPYKCVSDFIPDIVNWLM